jgi:hypothetical protein
MRGLKHHRANTFDFHQKVISRKLDAVFRARVSIHDPTVKTLFDNYDLAFANTRLTEMVRHGGFTKIDIDDFEELYSYKSRVMQDLLKEVTTVEHNRICNTCQNCTINEVNSFDHLLPQSEFPEFIVNPKNLFPSCSKCNGHKSTAWRNGFVGNFLNLYLDQLPQVQYLFVDLVVSPDPNGLIETYYDIRNTAGIEPNFFNRIYSHYHRLQLRKRFSLNSDSVITDLISTFKHAKNKNDTVDETINACNENRQILGFNHWKDILKIQLVNNPNFLARFP